MYTPHIPFIDPAPSNLRVVENMASMWDDGRQERSYKEFMKDPGILSTQMTRGLLTHKMPILLSLR